MFSMIPSELRIGMEWNDQGMEWNKQDSGMSLCSIFMIMFGVELNFHIYVICE